MFTAPGQSREGNDVGRATVAQFNALGMESRIGPAGRPQQHIDPTIDQQCQIIAGRWINLQLQVFAAAQLDHRRTLEQRWRDHQSEGAPDQRRGSRFGCVGDRTKRRAYGWQKRLALRRQQNTTRQATEQRDAEGPLERPYLLADRARCHAQLAGGVLEAQMTGGSLEGA